MVPPDAHRVNGPPAHGPGRTPRVELLTIGNELLLGETVDSNAAWLGRRLAGAGVRVARRATVGDGADDIRDAMSEALDRTGVLLCTGGLGPTRDDVTKGVAAAILGRRLLLDEGLLRSLEERFAAMGRPMARSNRSQAEVPEGARVLPNERGTAPGLVLERQDGALLVLLPGVPAEMRALFDGQLLPLLEERWPERDRPIRHHTIRTTGLPESELADRLEPVLEHLTPVEVAFLPSAVGVDLRLTSWGVLPGSRLDITFAEAEQRVRQAVGRYVYGVGDADLTDAVAESMRRRALRLVVAESCTGGLIAKRLTERAGASDYFLGGVVAYDNRIKESALDVPHETLERHGAVSEAVALAMAHGARRRLGADAAVAVTGVAGPGGGTEDKPVGTVWIAVAYGERGRARRLRLPGDRGEVRDRSAQAALALLWHVLEES